MVLMSHTSIMSLAVDADWQNRAECQGTLGLGWCDGDPAFTPLELRAYCGVCPVQQECLVDALRHNDYCIRAGLTRRQRNALKRPRLRTDCPVCGSMLDPPDDYKQPCPGCGLVWRTMRRTPTEPSVC
jgi:hypothetical protein